MKESAHFAAHRQIQRRVSVQIATVLVDARFEKSLSDVHVIVNARIVQSRSTSTPTNTIPISLDNSLFYLKSDSLIVLLLLCESDSRLIECVLSPRQSV